MRRLLLLFGAVLLFWSFAPLVQAEKRIILSTGTLSATEGDYLRSSSHPLTISLSEAPSGQVHLTFRPNSSALRFGLTGEGLSHLVSTSNWNNPRQLNYGYNIVGLTAVTLASAEQDPNAVSEAVTVRVQAFGGGYNGVETTLTVNIADDDQGVVLPTSAVAVNEGSTARFKVRLNQPPNGSSQTQTVTLMQPGNADVRVDTDRNTPGNQNILNFTSSNWSTGLDVTVSAAQDLDGMDESARISASSPGIYPASMSVSVTDDDPALLLPSAPVSVNEGDTASFRVSLNKSPGSGGLAVSLGQPDNIDVTVSPATLNFTDGNWSTGLYVRVSASEDSDAAGDSAAIAVSAPGIQSGSVAVTVLDDDTADMVLPTSAVSVREGMTATFKVRLDRDPGTSGLAVTLSQPDNTDVTVDTDTSAPGNQTALNFDGGNWFEGLDVTVRASQDSTLDDETATINLSGAGGISGRVSVAVSDDEEFQLAGVPTSALTLTEGAAGTTVSTFRLAGPPSGEVDLRFSSSSAKVTVDADTVTSGSQSTLTFTARNWNTAQGIVLAAPEDADASDETVTISISASGGGFDGVTGSFQVQVDDNDTAGIGLGSYPDLIARIGEGSGGGTKRVWLTAQPSGNVTLQISNSLPGMQVCAVTLTGCPAAFTFTPSNYSVEQSIKITALEDANAVNEIGTATFTASGGGYSGVSRSLQIGTLDNDTAGLIVGGARSATEGGTGSFTVRLRSEPTADVTVAATAGSDIASVAPASLTFTPGNWNTDQTFTVTADTDTDTNFDDSTGSVSLRASGGDYGSVSAGVDIAVTDADAPDLDIAPAVLLVSEGAGGSYAVRLSGPPSDAVTVSATSGDAGAATVQSESLVFTTSNWNVAQNFSVTSSEDTDTDNESTVITFSASGGGYAGVTRAAAFNAADNDAHRLVLSEAALLLNEGAAGRAFTVSLSQAPTANVSVTLSTGGDVSAVTISPAATWFGATVLTFTPSNWQTPQSVTVTPVDDNDFANEILSISLIAAGGGYDGADGRVPIQVLDDDAPGLIWNSTDRAYTETDASHTTSLPLSFRLAHEPSGNVMFNVTSSNPDFSVQPHDTGGFVISADSWSASQSINTILAPDEDAADETARITLIFSGGGYGGFTESFDITIDDDETAGLTIADASSLQEGGSGSFTVALSAVPTVNVTVTPSAGDGIASVAPASLNFTPTNWSAPQTVTVEAGTDADSTASTGRVALSASGGEYGGVSADVDFSIADTAAGALAVQPASASVIEGADATYRVSLSLRPSGDVTVSASSARPAAASVGSTDLTFTSSNWDTPQSLAVSALEDTDSANEVVSIVLTASGGGYSGVSRSLTLNIVDNEAAVLVLSETSLELGEGGAAGAFAVRLSAQPSATVQLRVMSGDPARVEVDAVSGTTGLQSWTTFTPSNWSTPQTISVRALEDSDRSSETVAVSLVASGGGYSGQTGSVSVSVIDDEFLGFVLSGMAVTVDEGGSTSFGVRLNQAPTENVGAALTVPAGDVMVDALSLTFTPADWDTEQHITVYAAQDADADDDSLILTLTASGGRYAGASSDIAVTIDDDDDPNLVLSSRTLSIGEGEAAVFKVMLDGAPPSGGLTATLTQPGNADVTVDAHAASSTLQTRLNFNAGNWSSGLEVTVRAGHDDDLVDDSATIQIAVAGGDSDSLTVQVDDDDEAQLSGLPTSALTVVEGAGSTISGFWLSAQPGADVTVAFASSNTDSVTLSPASLTFTADNWDTAQSITLTGVEDSDADDETVSISITAAGGGFDGLASSFQALVDDNDTAAIQVPNQENLVAINEDVTISQGVRLTSRPSGTVTLTLSTSLSSMQICQNVPSICPQTLTFTPGNYSALQYFKLWSRPDHNAFDETGTATFAAAGGGYDGVTLSVPIGSNDSGTTGLNIGGDRSATEGGAGSFTVRLNSEPISDVTLSATPGRGIASVSPASLRFTQSNWNADQTVTATTSIDDSVLSDTTGLISLSAAGGDYGGVTETVSIDIANSGSGTLRVTPASQAVLEGHTGTILVRLNAQPSGNVTVSASGDDDSAVAVLDETLTFTELTWDTVQQVAVSALDDADADSERVTVEFSASGGGYSGATESVTVRTVEDDASGLWISADALSLVEGAPAATFTVRLSRAPTQNVAVTLSSSGDTGAATVNAGTGAGTSNASSELSFTPSNWDVLQTVSVAPTADDGDARSESLTITLSAAGGSFDGATGSVQVTVLDDDTQALSGSAADAALDEGLNSGVISAPEGGFTVGLSSEPSAAVTVTLKSANPDVAFLNASGERISSIVLDDWGAGALQTLYYAVAHDGDASDETAAITLSAAGGGFDGIALEYTLTIRDDEVPGISVSPGTVRNRLTLAEGGMGSFYAALTQPPMVDVQVALDASDIAAGYALSPMSASFTPNNWNSPREFQLSVPEDADASDERTSISLNASGGIYTGVSQDVLVTIQDDEMAGLNVSPAGMLSATEGEAADYSVSLSTPPTDSVTVSAISDDPSAVSLGAMALTFSRANWNTAQSLRVNALQDADRANESVTITLTASGGGYGSVSRGLSFQVIDDDATSLVLSHSALGVDEGGQAGRFTVRLSSQPSGSVWIALASGEPARVEVDAAPGTTGRQSRMTFTASNWNIPQIVSVRGLDDADGSDDSVTVNLRASGGGYDGQSASVAVSVMDDESFSLVVSETSMTLEEGAAGSFSVQLNTAPSVDVTVALALPSGSDLTANPPTLIFTPSNWNVARDVSVSAGQDADTLNDSAELSLSASGGEFSGASAQVAVMVDDDDNPGLVLPSAAISAAESVPVIFGVRLSTQPSADVTLTLMQPSNPDVTVDADTSASGNQNVMTFTPQNWRISQNVSVMSGEDDDAADDSAVLRIVAAGGGYDLVSAEVEVSVADNDSPALTLSHTALTVGESGVATFAVQLSTQPSQDVRLTLTSSDTTALTVRVGGTAAAANSAGLLFTPENWSAAQSVTLAGVDDADTLSELVTVAVSASGGEYAGVSAHLAATLTDDDAPQLVVTPSLALTEGGAAGSLSVRLDTQPSADLTVTVAVSGGDADALRVTAGASLIFTPLNWSVDQTVSISPADDADANDQSTTITMSVAAAAGGTAASGYESISATTTVTVTDDDAEGLSISPVQLTVEEGASATFEVRLTSEPNADVTVTLGQPDNTDITLSAGGGNVLTFTGANWNTAQTVTVSAAEDRDGIDDAASAISLTADEAGAADGGYEGVSASVAVSVQDDDEIALTLSQGSVTVDEGGSASFSVQLATQPDDTVTVALRQPGNADITVSTAYAGTSGEATLIFASTSWDMPQMVTLSAAQDDDAIDDAGSISLTASGGGYDSATGSVSVTVDDDEGVGFTLVQETLSLVEGGDAESFTVALSSRPTSRVRLTLDNPDPEALTLTSGQAGTTGGRIELTFSAIDWNAPQTLSAQAVEDSDTGDESVGIVLTASGGGYDGVTGSYVISVTDNDSPSLRLSRSDVALDEGGATMNFTVRLIGQPSEDVTVSVTSSDAGAVSVSAGATLVFTPRNWDTPQRVTLNPQDDVDAYDESAVITLSASGTDYAGISASVSVSVTDDEEMGLALSWSEAVVIEGASESLDVSLISAPTGDVQVSAKSADLGAVAVTSEALTFTRENWNIPQAVMLQSQQDDDARSESVRLTLISSGGDYDGQSAAAVVAVTDNDRAGLVAPQEAVEVSEGGSAFFNVRLTSQPASGVAVALAVGGDLSLSHPTVNFTSVDWNRNRVVRVDAGHDDDALDDVQTLELTASGADYGGVTGR
ncbi:MAG: hypothetical protein ISN29_00660, partial [Gammaproteobacteria bacterium AqS3]|nr:hypothetical protein [Gammaproteobacteria bacterium AqS3]